MEAKAIKWKTGPYNIEICESRDGEYVSVFVLNEYEDENIGIDIEPDDWEFLRGAIDNAFAQIKITNN